MADLTKNLNFKITFDSKGAVKGIEQISGKTREYEKTSASIFSKIRGSWLGVVAAITGVVAAFVKVTKITKEFEAAIARVASVTGKQAIPALEKFAREAAKKTKFTAKEAADALFFLASAGLSVAEMGDVLTPALELATAANLEIAEATDLVVGNLKVFADEALSAAEASDIMTRTNQLANTDVRQLGEALKITGATANLAGVSFKDINAIIGAFANQGLKGSEAGTKLRMTFARLIKPMGEAGDILRDKVGITADEISTLLSKPGGVIELFEKLRGANLTTAEATEIFGVRQLAVFKLIKSGIPDIKRFSEELNNAGGTAKKAAETQLDTLDGKLLLLKSAFQELVLSITSGGFNDALTGVVESLTDVALSIGDFVKSDAGVRTLAVTFGILKLTVKSVANIIKTAGRIIYAAIIPIIEPLKSASQIMTILGDASLSTSEKFKKLKSVGIDTLTNIKDASIENFQAMADENQKMSEESLKIYNSMFGEIDRKRKEDKQADIEDKRDRIEILQEYNTQVVEQNTLTAEQLEEMKAAIDALDKERQDAHKEKTIADLLEERNLFKEHYKELGISKEKSDAYIALLDEQIKKKRIANQKKIFDYTSNMASNISQLSKNLTDLQIENIKKQEETSGQVDKKGRQRLKNRWVINKAAQIASIAANAATATAAALAPPPIGLGPVAGMGLATVIAGVAATQSLLIARQKLPEFKEGGTVGGVGGPDSQLVRATPGETMLNPAQSENLFNNLESAGLLSSTVSNTTNDNRDYTMNFAGANFNLPNVNNTQDFLDELQNVGSKMGINMFRR